MSDWNSHPGAVERATEMWLAGSTASAIAREIGPWCSKSAVIGKMKRLGVKCPSTVYKAKRQPHVSAPLTAAPALPPPPPNCDPVHILKLDHTHCRWPLWDHEGETTNLYCGAVSERGAPYCEFHKAKAWSGIPKLKPRERAA